MGNRIYILSSKDKGSMRIRGVAEDETWLCAMAAVLIRNGEMGYGDLKGKPAWESLRQDVISGTPDWERLPDGCVEIRRDVKEAWRMMPPDRIQGAEEMYRELTEAEIMKLGLERRSLVWSVMEVGAGNEFGTFFLPGIGDRLGLEKCDGFMEMMRSTCGGEVNAGVFVYRSGAGDAGKPDRRELDTIRRHEKEIERRYGTDEIMSDFFGFRYFRKQ